MNTISDLAQGFKGITSKGAATKRLVLMVVVVAALAVVGVADAAGGYTFLASWGSAGSGDGQLNHPYGVAVDLAGNVFVADTGNNRIQKFTRTGAFLTSWGSLGSGNGQFNRPYGIAVDSGGNVFVADTGNNRIQKFTGTGTFLASWGSYGSGDGQMYWPSGVAVDSSGNVYVAEMYNHRVQEFTSTGTAVTKWGSYGTGEGQFEYPYGIGVDSTGSVYVSDIYNYRVQKFSSAGAFLAKWGSYGDGDGQFQNPSGLAVDSSAHVFVADTYNNRIQKFSGAGVLLTRWGVLGSGDGQLDRPYGLATDSAGNIFVADTNNSRIQIFASDTTPPVITPTITGTSGNNGWYGGDVTVNWSVTDPESGIASSLGCGTTVLTADTGGTTLTCTATNGVGLQSSGSVTIRIDRTAPTITRSIVSGPQFTAGSNSYMTSATTARVSVLDSASALASCTITVTGPAGVSNLACAAGDNSFALSGPDGTYTISATAADNAGNRAILNETVILDNAPPILGDCPRAGTFAFGSGVQTVGPITVDDGVGSGLNAAASILTGLVDTNVPGLTGFTATFSATDNLGNGPVSKGCTYGVTVKAAMQSVLSGLKALRVGVIDNQDGNKLDQAIRNVSNSLEPILWVDGNYLVPQYGDKVFNELKNAVNKLSQVVADQNGSLDGNQQLQGYIDRLMAASSQLALLAAGNTSTVNATVRVQAGGELDRGHSDRAEGRRESAIEHDRNAWQHAMKAASRR